MRPPSLMARSLLAEAPVSACMTCKALRQIIRRTGFKSAGCADNLAERKTAASGESYN